MTTNTGEFLNDLSPVQKEAVLYFDSPLMVIAGAGSGKTKVITNKIAYLVMEKSFSPHQVLGVTFTNKAADEMKRRIESITGLEARLFNISTFHSLGLRILRESGSAFGFNSEWQVLDDQDQKKILERIIKENFNHFTNDMRDNVRRKIGLAKMELIYPNNKEFLLQKGFNYDQAKIFSLYYDFQKSNKLWDYEDLISLPVKFMQTHEEIRGKYADRFRYVVVDEFQDTNPNQYELLNLIAGEHKNVTVVGDDDQAIYSWRGACIRYLHHFENDFPGTRILKLEQNYRSTKPILDFANRLISRNTLRKAKSMWTKESSGNPVFVLDNRSKDDEARQVAEFALRLKEENPDLLPLAVLYRINSQSLAFETEFVRRNIRFKIIKGLRFFDRKEIKDSLALLKLTLNPDDDLSFLRMVDFLPLGIGIKTLDELSLLSKTNGTSLFRTFQQEMRDKFNSKPIFSIIMTLHQRLTMQPGSETDGANGKLELEEALKILLRESGYRGSLDNKGEESRLLNIDELIAFVKKWQESNPGGSFAQLADYMSLEGGKENESGDSDIPVLLLTMHNAKGLEFPTVVAAGVNTFYLPFYLRKDPADIEEERRLFYVASTRAIKQLVISIGSERRSQFLSDINQALYSMAYSVDDLINYLGNTTSPGQNARLRALLGQTSQNNEERYVEHKIFGRGKIISAMGKDKYLVDFVGRGEKVIDASLVPLTFL